MLKHLRRWHFDTALFLGLALFSWAYWYSKPQPRWSSELTRGEAASLIGLPDDGKKLLTLVQSASTGWIIPRIQHWDIATGKLISEHELKLNANEQEQVHSGGSIEQLSGGLMLEAPCCYFLYRKPIKNTNYWRLFDLEGTPLGPQLVSGVYELVRPLTMNTLANGQWPASIISYSGPVIAKLVDLLTGKDLHNFQPPEGMKCSSMQLFSDKKHLGIFWSEVFTRGKSEWRLLYDIYSMEDFRLLTRLEFPKASAGYFGEFLPIGSEYYVYPELRRLPQLEFTFLVYQFAPATGSMLPAPQHLLHGLQSQPGEWLYPLPPYLFKVQTIRDAPATGLVQQIKEWLARVGLQRDGTPRTNIEVCDLATGQPLRQLNGVPTAHAKLSPDGRFTVGIEGNTIHLYDVPHHLWTKSLSWLQWIGWGLVFLWPLRYLKPPHRVIPAIPAVNS